MSRNSFAKRFFAVFLIAVVISCSYMSTAFAHTNNYDYANSTPAPTSAPQSNFKQEAYAKVIEYADLVQTALSVFRTVAFAFGIVGIAFSGIQIITGNEQTAGKAVSKILIIIAALIALWLLPTVINFGRSLGLFTPYDPTHLNG